MTPEEQKAYDEGRKSAFADMHHQNARDRAIELALKTFPVNDIPVEKLLEKAESIFNFCQPPQEPKE